MKKLFITLEGVDGCGKTIASELLALRLMRKYGDDAVIKTREPGGVDIAEQIRGVLLNKNNTNMHSKTEALLYGAARIEHLDKVIIPALKEGKIVICDRFVDSTVAYQAYGRQNMDIQFIHDLNKIVCGNHMPNLTFVLDISEDEAKRRMKLRNEPLDRFDLESDAFRMRVRAGYNHIAQNEPERVHVINAEGTPEETVGAIMKIIDKYLEEE